MGSAIAALLAGAGLDVLLLDIVPDRLTPEEAARGLTLASREVRNRIAARALEQLRQQQPPPCFDPSDLTWIEVGNLEDDLPRLAACDWVIEAVVERLDVKQDVVARAALHLKPEAVLSTNTSGLSIAAIAEGCPPEVRRRFLGTHFFNPPRYMKLLEIIPGPDTDPAVVARMQAFSAQVLGKGVVIAKDTPNFIANRIGTYALAITLDAMAAFGLAPDEVDDLTGPVMGRPQSATFRTLDLVGIDTYVHVARHMQQALPDPAERAVFAVPAFIEEMVARGWTGEKAGGGFYRRNRETGELEVLDLATWSYRPRRRLSSPVIEAARALPSAADRLRALLQGGDRAADFAWFVLKKVLLYAAEKLPEIADDVAAVDQAMKWGFRWELGPFEMWDALGVTALARRMEAEGERLPQAVAQVASRQPAVFYERGTGGVLRCYTAAGVYRGVEQPPERISLVQLKEAGHLVAGNPGASLVDLGDGVLCLEWHAPKQAIGPDVIAMMEQAADEVEARWEALVIGHEGRHFCVGANLMLMLMEAEDENWDEIDAMVRRFQQAVLRLKYLRKPVVAAPFGMTLGGGLEVCFAAARVQAAAEAYLGLVETGVGLIPAGGGTKEMALRAASRIPPGVEVRLDPFLRFAFETVALAKVSTSAQDAKRLGYLRAEDGVTFDRDRLLYDAKQAALGLARSGYRPPRPARIPVGGEPAAAALKVGVADMHLAGRITDHDVKIAHHLIRVMTGGDLPRGTEVPESYLLDLEREAFLSLIGEEKTRQRMRHMLATGKPLRN